MKISLIIPTLNEEKNIDQLLSYLKDLPDQYLLQEIIVCDGGSRDKTVEVAGQAGAEVLHAPARGRAIQMNHAASTAQGNILYFVHADVLPPQNCLSEILNAIEKGHHMGCCCYEFNSDSKLLKFNARMTRFDWLASGGGDQTFFILKEDFERLGGFDEELPIMEDFDFVWRAKKHFPLHVIQSKALVSARKYKNNSYLKVQLVNTLVFTLFRWGACPHKLARMYKKMLL